MKDLRARLARLSQTPEAQHASATPSWLVSFGDMMTCILTFFILLCTLAREREPGNVAAGIGSFIQRLDALGLPGLMPNPRQAEVELRELERKFARAMQAARQGSADQGGFDREEEYQRAAQEDERRDPDHWIPDVAVFADESTVLSPASRRRLNDLVPVLQARPDPWVYLEAHAPTPGGPNESEAVGRAIARIEAVRDLFVTRGIPQGRLIPRLRPEDNSTAGGSVSLRFEPKGE
ncbi:MAG: hypothetical protein H6834_04940 [Planctomycetes bacterium]|nr:hypothetical protein [Planctomycetota bacterium]